ncbi:Nif3-like dinuclear metal center hexameric protein [Deinococcus hopiensis]|uniref:Putative GTP cyclohydrolase 1 type 2, NIF3 family n=1 Tax=Deinococcus hopiensis KR-140 TaxID=695939 RepID=A0A1W1V932_9DEIO|nr:Nif3-like dinuclear metal center hexameric protein [Deinococcus hopiensis]SMB89967.1 Putative GTP cyclohydrolase 1 type 2, NIF3 family [Deinococcus hopiensis KR-140]
MTPPTLQDLAGWLGAHLGEPTPLLRSGPSPVQRLALALEPADLPPGPTADALFLHRARRLGERWPGIGVLAVHDGFDMHLTTGPNWRLARKLGWRKVEEVTWGGRTVGLIATPPEATEQAFHAALLAELGGNDSSWPPADTAFLRVALINAMNPSLLTHVAGLGGTIYLTGQLRPSAVAAARELGLGVVALGHRRTELWGLRQLARELRVAFPELETAVYAG